MCEALDILSLASLPSSLSCLPLLPTLCALLPSALPLSPIGGGALSVRIASLRLCASLIQHAPLDTVNIACVDALARGGGEEGMRREEGEEEGNRGLIGIHTAVCEEVKRILTVGWLGVQRDSRRPAAPQESVSLLPHLLSFLRVLVVKGGDPLLSLHTSPLSSLHTLSSVVSPSPAFANALLSLALFGGEIPGVCVGARVRVPSETGVLLAFLPSSSVLVACDSDPTVPVTLPTDDVQPLVSMVRRAFAVVSPSLTRLLSCANRVFVCLLRHNRLPLAKMMK